MLRWRRSVGVQNARPLCRQDIRRRPRWRRCAVRFRRPSLLVVGNSVVVVEVTCQKKSSGMALAVPALRHERRPSIASPHSGGTTAPGLPIPLTAPVCHGSKPSASYVGRETSYLDRPFIRWDTTIRGWSQIGPRSAQRNLVGQQGLRAALSTALSFSSYERRKSSREPASTLSRPSDLFIRLRGPRPLDCHWGLGRDAAAVQGVFNRKTT